MHVVALVAANAQLREPLQHPSARMALFAEQPIVRAAEANREDVVARVDLLPRRGLVAALAADA